MSPSPLKMPGPDSGSCSGAGSEQASCVGSDRHQSSTTAAPTESSNVDIGSGKLITFFLSLSSYYAYLTTYLFFSLLFCSRPTPSAILFSVSTQTQTLTQLANQALPHIFTRLARSSIHARVTAGRTRAITARLNCPEPGDAGTRTSKVSKLLMHQTT